MKNVALILTFFLVSQSAFSKPIKKFDSGQLWASHFAGRLIKIKKPEDILKYLNLSKAHQEEINQAIKENKISIPKVKYRVYLDQIFMIDEEKNRTVIDFSKFKYKRLIVNKKSIRLTRDKSYNDYFFEVSKAINQEKVSFVDFLFEPTFAQDKSNSIARFLASIFASGSEYTEGSGADDNVENALIRMYEKDVKQARITARGGPLDLTSNSFKCEGDRLVAIHEFIIQNGEEKSPPKGSKFFRVHSTGGYSYENGTGTVRCDAKVIDSGMVDSIVAIDESLCPSNRMSIFSNPHFFGRYPLLLEKCCEQDGCFEKVEDYLKTERSKLVKESPKPPEPGYELSDPVSPADKGSEGLDE